MDIRNCKNRLLRTFINQLPLLFIFVAFDSMNKRIVPRLHQIDVCILWRPKFFLSFRCCFVRFAHFRRVETARTCAKLKLVPENLKSWKYFAKLVTFLNLIGEPNCHIRRWAKWMEEKPNKSKWHTEMAVERTRQREKRRNLWSWTRSSVWAWLRAYICMSANIDPLIKIAFRCSLVLAL